jgi:phosphoglycolate phosphatase-like HAD superfamily hydrolase
MPPSAVICDWNGTLISDRNESPILESIAKGIFKTYIPFHPRRMRRILKARDAIAALPRERPDDPDYNYSRAIIRIYNDEIISGAPVSAIYNSIDKYANMQQTLDKLDHRVLQPVKECYRAGKVTGILSAGLRYGIEMILNAAGYGEYFNFTMADEISQKHGKAIEYALNIYQQKPGLLLNLLKEKKLDADKVAYLGDSEDDEGCFEIVKYPVISFFTPEKQKEKYASKYKAFVPKDEKDLARYLTCA